MHWNFQRSLPHALHCLPALVYSNSVKIIDEEAYRGPDYNKSYQKNVRRLTHFTAGLWRSNGSTMPKHVYCNGRM